MGQLQTGTGVGDVVGAGDDRGSLSDLHPSTPAGQSLVFVVLAGLVLALTIGRSTPGPRKALVIGEFVLVIMAASVIGNYALRTVALLHPDVPGADAIHFTV